MFRLLRWLIAFVLLAGLVYVAFTVPLGTKTLWGHLRAIAGTDETQELVEGVKQKAGEILTPSDGALRGGGALRDSDETDGLSAAEREALRRLIRDRLQRSSQADSGKPGEHPRDAP